MYHRPGPPRITFLIALSFVPSAFAAPKPSPSEPPIVYEENRIGVAGETARRVDTNKGRSTVNGMGQGPFGNGGVFVGEQPATGTVPGYVPVEINSATVQVVESYALTLQNRRYSYRVPNARGPMMERSLEVGARLTHSQMSEFVTSSAGAFPSSTVCTNDGLYKTNAINVTGAGGILPGYRFNDGATFIYLQGGMNAAATYGKAMPPVSAANASGEGSWVYIGVGAGGGVGREIGKGALLVGPVAETGVRTRAGNGAARESTVGMRAKFIAANADVEAMMSRGSETPVLASSPAEQARIGKILNLGCKVTIRLTPRLGAAASLAYRQTSYPTVKTEAGFGGPGSVNDQSWKTLSIGAQGIWYLPGPKNRPIRLNRATSSTPEISPRD